MTDHLELALKHWWVNEVASSPMTDPRHTADCLHIAEIDDVVASIQPMTFAQQEHVQHCHWCTRLLALAGEHDRKPVTSSAVIAWSPLFSEQLAAWLHETMRRKQAELTATPAHFDSQGMLRVHWTGARPEGEVILFLSWNGDDIELARGCVRHGVLELVEPLAHMGVRDQEIPASVLRLEALPAPGLLK